MDKLILLRVYIHVLRNPILSGCLPGIAEYQCNAHVSYISCRGHFCKRSGALSEVVRSSFGGCPRIQFVSPPKLVCFSPYWPGLAWPGLGLLGLAWVWAGPAWAVLARAGLAWPGLAQPAIAWHCSF